MKIYGFIHVYAVNNWLDIFENQLSKIKISGLYWKLEKIFVGVNTEYKTIAKPSVDSKVDVLYYLNAPDEALTLSFLHKFCYEANAKVFYIHTKGVSRNSPQNQVDWRNLMEYFIIENHISCLRELEKNDIVGVNWHLGEGYMNASTKSCGGTEVTPHFSGNFWWANSDYIRKLPSIYPINSRYECEFWIGKAHPRVAELWHSGVYHHRNTYEPSNYIGKENVRYHRY